MKEVHLTIGLPASGKSTYLRNLLAGRPHTILNADMIREELTGDATCQTENDRVFKIHHARYKEFLLSDKPEHQVIGIDNTSITSSVRKQYWKFAEELGVEVKFFIYVFKINAEQCKERQKGRSRIVPDHVIDDMWGRMSYPTFEEIVHFGDTVEIYDIHLGDELLNKKRFAFIADVHGSINQLNKLLGYLGFWKDNGSWCSAGAFQLVFLGDLNDYRHPETVAQSNSVACIRTAKELDEAGFAQTMYSNHQNKLIRWGRGNKVVISQGLEHTIKDFNAISEKEKIELLEWLDKKTFYWDMISEDGKNYGVAHAYYADWFDNEFDWENPFPKKVRDLCIYGAGTAKTDFDKTKYATFEEMQAVEGSHVRDNWWEKPEFLEKIKEVDKIIVGHYHIVLMTEKIVILDGECGKGGDLLAYIPSLEKVIGASL